MYKNEKGYALLVTIVAIVLLTILGVGIVSVSSKSLTTSTSERTGHSLFYLAEAGINYKEAILIEEINKIYLEEKNDASNLTNSPDKFDNSFDAKIAALLFRENNTELNSANFTSTFNGNPIVKIKIDTKGSVRSFTLTSEARLEGQAGVKKVERDYKIPDNLLTVTQYEVPVETKPPTSNDGNLGIGNPINTDFKNTGNLYIREYLNMSLVPKNNYNAKFHVAYKYNFWTDYLEITPNSNRDNITYNSTMPTFPTSKATYLDAPSVASNPNKEITFTNSIIDVNSDLRMKKLPNFSNKVINLNIQPGEHDLVFTDSFLSYNFSSLRFNITGTGTLNIVFNKYYELNLLRKFIVNAPNTKVNLIFKDGATIRGEMIAQDLFLKGRLEPTLVGKLIANNVYVSDGTFDKDFQSQVKINNLYMKKGNLNISSPTAFYANDVVLEDGNITLNTGSELIGNTIYVKDGDLRSHLTTCVQADTISVPKKTTRFDDEANFNKFYGNRLFMIATSHINKSVCGKTPVVISPEVPEEQGQTETKTRYDFLETDIIGKGNIIEIK